MSECMWRMATHWHWGGVIKICEFSIKSRVYLIKRFDFSVFHVHTNPDDPFKCMPLYCIAREPTNEADPTDIIHSQRHRYYCIHTKIVGADVEDEEWGIVHRQWNRAATRRSSSSSVKMSTGTERGMQKRTCNFKWMRQAGMDRREERMIVHKSQTRPSASVLHSCPF